MEINRPKVKEFLLYREIVRNRINPLEVIKEAIDNSVNAEAKNIVIKIYRKENGEFSLIIEDDGIGMSKNDLKAFFNLGNFEKSIKVNRRNGFGSKIFFRCDKLIIETYKENYEKIYAYMNKPWENLKKGKLPKYFVDYGSEKANKQGTKIRIDNYLIDNPEKTLNFYTIKDYIQWFTAAGSFKNIFSNCSENIFYTGDMKTIPKIIIKDEINGIENEFIGVHLFEEMDENPKEDINEQIYKRSINYCKHFGPYYRTTNIDGKLISFQLYGTVSGLNCKKKISRMREGESYSERFGVYLARDFIPISKIDLIKDSKLNHFHLLLNSQNFELTMDKNKIYNNENREIKWVMDTAKKIVNEEILPVAESTYFKMRYEEEFYYLRKIKKERLEREMKKYKAILDIPIPNIALKKKPNNGPETALVLAVLLSNPEYRIFIGHISSIASCSTYFNSELICIDKNGHQVYVEVEFLLSGILNCPRMKMLDYIVCWRVDIEKNKKILIDDIELKLCFENNEYYFQYCQRSRIYIIELDSIINKIREKNRNN